MLHIRKQYVIATALAGIFATPALAAVSAEEAKALGGSTLTEWGAERAGNKDGSIPAWTNEKVKVPASYNPKEPGQTPDPWNDKPLYTITAANMDKYASRLTPGQMQMLKQYPGFRMDIYPTRRTIDFTKWAIESTIKNATSAKATNGGIKLEGAYGGVPFPIPKNGNEVVWNHLLAVQPVAIAGQTVVFTVDGTGKVVNQGIQDVTYQFPYWDPSIPGIRPSNSQYWVLRFDALSPARKVGEKYVIIMALDPKDPGLRAWQYIPGQRRVKLAPDLAYDTPSPVSGGNSNMDQGQVFLGAQDRFDMKLVGKEEKYVMANDQRIQDYKVCPPEKVFIKNYQNPDCVRFELHRVWRVDMTLKPGFRNSQPKRSAWFDEDWTGAAVGDTYDAAGKLWRHDYSQISLYYDSGDGHNWQANHSSLTYDLQNGAYVNQSWMAFKEGTIVGGYSINKNPKPATFFSPEALAGAGVR